MFFKTVEAKSKKKLCIIPIFKTVSNPDKKS